MATDWIWNKAWVAGWLVGVLASAATAPWAPFWPWAAGTGAAFAGMEGFALVYAMRRFETKQARWRSPYPPLTYTASYYLPRWALYVLTGGAIGFIAVRLFAHVPDHAAGPLTLGLFSWLVEHWEVTYREMPRPK